MCSATTRRAGGGQHEHRRRVPAIELDRPSMTVIDAGIPVVAAGNEANDPFEDPDACFSSPGEVHDAITVAASTKSGNRAEFSNYGHCVDIFAPGKSVLSASTGSGSATAVMSGTSMAAPHVTGGVARYLQGHPSASPAQVRTALVGDSTRSARGRRQGIAEPAALSAPQHHRCADLAFGESLRAKDQAELEPAVRVRHLGGVAGIRSPGVGAMSTATRSAGPRSPPRRGPTSSRA